jgi:putative membrane protein
MRTKLTLALIACAALAFSPSLFAQSKDGKEDGKGALAGQDLKYFRQLAQGNIAEVELGKLAEKQAASDEVKKFARQMVDDHGKMLEEQQQLAKQKSVQTPRGPGRQHRAELRKLEKLSGEQFDRAYMNDMVKDHEKDLKLVQEAQHNVKDPELKAALEKSAPVIQKHLEMAKQIAGKQS